MGLSNLQIQCVAISDMVQRILVSSPDLETVSQGMILYSDSSSMGVRVGHSLKRSIDGLLLFLLHGCALHSYLRLGAVCLMSLRCGESPASVGDLFVEIYVSMKRKLAIDRGRRSLCSNDHDGSETSLRNRS